VTTVIGRLPGRDPALSAEAVVYKAHDDPASGLATMLAVAEAFVALPDRPRRSILFVAVADEEDGPFDAALLARHPRVAASFDIHGSRVRSLTHPVPVVGLGPSSLEEWVRAIAHTQGRPMVPDLTAGWDSSGGVEDAQLLFLLGAKVADAPLAPSGRQGDALEGALRNDHAELGR
jgi:hypothetical protein